MRQAPRFLFLACLMTSQIFASPAQSAEPRPTHSANENDFLYSGYVKMELVEAPATLPGQAVRFQRIQGLNGKAYGWDNPGTRIAFSTNSKKVSAFLYYSPKHTSNSARNAKGRFFIDGLTQPDWTYDTVNQDTLREPEIVEVAFPCQSEEGFRTFEIVLPYGDAVEFLGVEIEPGAELKKPAPERTVRYVAYGDSVTQGFTASSIDHTYPYLLAELQGWELINYGLAGRRSNTIDGKVIAKLEPDVITMLIGVNDWQGGLELNRYRKNVLTTLSDIRTTLPDTPIYMITPLWVPERWNPRSEKYELEEYRKVLREIAAESDDPNLILVEGPELIDHVEENFDRVAVHPSDAGFAQMAVRLDRRIQ